MAVLEILEFPDPRLRTRAKPVAEVTNATRRLVADMLETMYDAPGIGLADGIWDLVSTGSTLFSNGLKEVEVILRSEAVLAVCPGLSGEKEAILEQLLFRIEAVRKANANKYIVLNSPNHAIETISAILPGMKSPTVVPLARDGWSALHSVMSEEKFWEVIDQLKLAGAEGILVMPIEKNDFVTRIVPIRSPVRTELV